MAKSTFHDKTLFFVDRADIHRGVEIDYRRYSEDSSSVPLTKVRRVKFSIWLNVYNLCFHF